MPQRASDVRATEDKGDLLARLAVTRAGCGSPAIVFLHGFGTDQTVWREVAPRFAGRHEVVTYDQMGSGKSASRGLDAARYHALGGYAEDLAAILDALDIPSCVVVGHSVSGMIGLLAARRTPRIAKLVMIASSPHYLNDEGYRGGFERADVDDLLSLMELDLQGWARAMAHTALSEAGRPDLVEELTYSFNHANPDLLRNFARATFLSDHRPLLSGCAIPTLVLQPYDDAIVPWEAAQHLASNLPDARLRRLAARGHFPQLSAAPEVIREISDFIARSSHEGR
jgi:sigma-B regulation protein RsbQ